MDFLLLLLDRNQNRCQHPLLTSGVVSAPQVEGSGSMSSQEMVQLTSPS